MKKQLKKYLDSISAKEFDKEWKEIENMSIGSECPCVFDIETNRIIFTKKINDVMRFTNIKCEKVNIDFSNLIEISVLLYYKYYDEPLLSYCIGENNTNYLIYWVDHDKKYNRVLIIKTETSTIYDYLSKKINLLSIINNSPEGFVYMADINNKFKFCNKKKVLIKDLPVDYLPSEESYY